MGVSKNNGTPKSSILIGFSIINHPFWVPLFLETSKYSEGDKDASLWGESNDQGSMRWFASEMGFRLPGILNLMSLHFQRRPLWVCFAAFVEKMAKECYKLSQCPLHNFFSDFFQISFLRILEEKFKAFFDSTVFVAMLASCPLQPKSHYGAWGLARSASNAMSKATSIGFLLRFLLLSYFHAYTE